jgi:hypothetical protein
MEICSKCEVLKEVTDFAKGYKKCKSCCYETKKLYRQSEKGKEGRRREAINARLSGKKQERQERYEATEKGKLALKKYEAKRYSSEEGKIKLAAKNAVKYAVKMGKLIKMPCFICGNSLSEAHHSSYSKDMRLVVTWLCKPHHNEIHNPIGH